MYKVGILKNLLKLLFFIIVIPSLLHAGEQQLEKVSLQLTWKNQFQFAGYYVAKEKGYYSDVGLDVEIHEYDNNLEDEVVLNNEATYAVGHSSLLADIVNGKKLKMLFSIFESSPLVFIALKDSNISTIKDFAGKKIMLTPSMSSTVSIQALLKKNGVSTSSIHIQEHSYNIESLLNGETDIMASYISNEPYLLEKLGKKFVVFKPADEGFDFYSDILFTSDKEVLLHPHRVKVFVDASLKGWEYAFSHIDESAELILKKYNTQNRSKEALQYEAESLKKLAYATRTQLGELQRDKLQRIYDIYNVMGFLRNEVSINTLYLPFGKKLLSPDEEQYLREKKVIKYCIDPDWMPYEKIEDAKHIGMSADYFKLFNKSLKVDMQLVQTESWAESLEFVKAGKCDLLALATKTPSREKYLKFTKPYIDVTAVMATRLNIPFIENFKDLKGKKIGITKGFALIEILKEKYPNFEIVEVKNSEDGLSKVVDGELFGYAGSLADIGHLFQNRFVGELKISGRFETVFSHCIAVRNGETVLYEIFDKLVDAITQEQKKEILNRWISIKYDERKDYTLLWWTLGVSFLGLSVMLILYWREKEINKIVQQQAARDYMTQLYNRRYFSDTAEHILDLARRNLSDIAIVMIDIDDFKHINDTYGHTAGDETIKALAKVMLDESRKSDMVARWGGEEFVILLPETDIEGATTIAEKIRIKTENLVMKTAVSTEFRLTISLGVSRVQIENDLSLEAAIMRADKALYEAKKSGKNRVCINIDEF